jgi:outer membrane lipopolysaccharide assembly protein LptE/RlpB
VKAIPKNIKKDDNEKLSENEATLVISQKTEKTNKTLEVQSMRTENRVHSVFKNGTNHR